MGDYRPNVDDVLEVNVSISEPVDKDTQKRLTEKLKDKLKTYMGITIIEGESLSDTNIQVLIRNSNSRIQPRLIDKVVGEAFSSEYNITEVNLVVSERRIIMEQETKPFLSRSNEVIYILVRDDNIPAVEEVGVSNIESYKRELLKDIDKKLPIRINDSSSLIYDKDFLGFEFKTDRSDITLTQIEQLQNLFENYDNLDLEYVTISSSSVI